MKLILRAKKTFELAQKSARLRSAKEKALYLVMTDKRKKHYIVKLPSNIQWMRFVDGRDVRLKNASDSEPVVNERITKDAKPKDEASKKKSKKTN